MTLRPGPPIPQFGNSIAEFAAARAEFARQLAEHKSMAIPRADPSLGEIGPAFLSLSCSIRQATL